MDSAELDECDRVILLYLYLTETARLKDIIENLKEKCENLNDRTSFYRRIERRLMKQGLVEKHQEGKNRTYYTLTEKGKKKLAKGVATKREIMMLIEKTIRKIKAKKIEKTNKGYIHFDIAIEKNNKKKYIKIVEGFTTPEDTQSLLETLKIIEKKRKRIRAREKNPQTPRNHSKRKNARSKPNTPSREKPRRRLHTNNHRHRPKKNTQKNKKPNKPNRKKHGPTPRPSTRKNRNTTKTKTQKPRNNIHKQKNNTTTRENDRVDFTIKINNLLKNSKKTNGDRKTIYGITREIMLKLTQNLPKNLNPYFQAIDCRTHHLC
ncbi:MAG: helix-turn-helix transcriptional regulator [Candidatus Njordarchaeia archaeon]